MVFRFHSAAIKLVSGVALESTSSRFQLDASPSQLTRRLVNRTRITPFKMERTTGLEPVSPVWKTGAQPIH